jgi:pimeloyl-ACP methyl ester carboxylesterase
MAYAIEHPEQVLGLVLVATGPGFRDAAKRDRWNRASSRTVVSFGLPPEVAVLLRQYNSDVIDGLAGITAPVLLVVGERDAMFVQSTQFMQPLFAGPTQSVVVASGGHMVHRGRTADEVNSLIVSFLRTIGVLSTVDGAAEHSGR